MTPVQTYALEEAMDDRVAHQEYMAGTIAAAVANFGGKGEKKKFLRASNFFPQLKEKFQRRRKKYRRSEVVNSLRQFCEEQTRLTNLSGVKSE